MTKASTTATAASLLLFTASLSASPAEGNGTRVGNASEAVETPVIDGKVDEEIWKDAEVFTDFIQSEPHEGQPATEKTEVRVLYDERAIYFGVICYDSDPNGLVVTDNRRDSDLTNMDSFQIVLDTYHDKQNGFVFGTNPAGIEYDGQVTNNGDSGQMGGTNRQVTGSGAGFNLNWDASWQVRTHVNVEGWMAEFEIPLRTLRYGSPPQTWGVNFYRSIRRKREEDYWSPVSRIYNLHRLSSAGELHNLNLETPRNFKVTPYVLGDASRDYQIQDESELDGDWGVDAKFGVTPSLNLDLTYNTDFAQVEVDEQQVNLTRFNLFFPEKRPFFLENAGIFSIGKSTGRDQAIDLFFSRKIGIDDDGGLVPILAGARLSGKAGNYNIGFLNMQTEDVLGVTPANNFTVARVSREFQTRSNLGAMFINRAATGDYADNDNWNRTWGVDGKLGIGEEWTFNGFAARTETPGKTGREYAYNVKGEYKDRDFRFSADYAEVGEEFNPEVGYLQRSGYRSIEGGPNWNIRVPSVSWLRELRPHVTYRGYWDFDGFKETEFIHMDMHVDWENGAHFSPAVNNTLEGLKEPFEITEGIVIPPGNYRNTALAWRWNTDLSAPIAYNGELDYGGFFSGTRRSITTELFFRRGSKLNVAAKWSYNDIDLEEGSFVVNLAQLRFNYSFTPFIYFQSLIQYNDDADIWSANLRFTWLTTASTGLYVVYNTTEGLGNMLIGPQQRSFIVKYTHQFDILK
jgi:hypothetical protein